MDCGLSEQAYWDMTLGEVTRFIQSYNRRQRAITKERATYIYILADLIGASNARLHSKNSNYPSLEEVFPQLFADDEQLQASKEQKRTELSIIRFKQFAESFNNRFNGGGGVDE